MAVQLESAARLAALRDKADAVTGESSATLAGAVDALIAGFGAGGGGEDTLGQLLADTLEEYSNDTATVIQNNLFLNKKTIKRIKFQAATTVGSSAFSGNTALEQLELPNATSFAVGFDTMTSLKKLCLPKATGFSTYTFNNHSLQLLDLPVIQSLPNQFAAYSRGISLNLLLRSTAGVCTLGGTNVLHNVKRICVPAALVESYKTATNWSSTNAYGTVLPDKIVALEDFTVDGTTTGAFDESKL